MPFESASPAHKIESMRDVRKAEAAEDPAAYQELLNDLSAGIASIESDNDAFLTYRNGEGLETDDLPISEIRVWTTGPDVEGNSLDAVLNRAAKSLNMTDEAGLIEFNALSVRDLKEELSARAS